MINPKKESVIFLFAIQIVFLNANEYAYTTWDPTKGIQIHTVVAETDDDALRKIPNNFTARAITENKINTTGWGFLEVHTNGQFEDTAQAYSAGYIEGYLTSDLIYQHWFNVLHDYCDKRQKMCQNVQNYLDINQRWINEMIGNYSSNQTYWHQVKLFYTQLEGLVEGYKNRPPSQSLPLTLNDFLWLNVQGDLEDLSTALDNSTANSTGAHRVRVLGSGSCSALVKLLPNNSNLYVGHDTWSSYQSMLRLQKKYAFRYRLLPGSHDLIPGHAMSFSSYPGTITSGDDFYLISSGLVALETTIGNSNDSLWRLVQPVGQVLESVRSMVANRVGHCGKSWSRTFLQFNSGTYNNQWMLVDYKRFKKGSAALQDRLLWVLEQIPGLIHARDMTAVLRNQTYWPSYNVPAFREVFNASGVPALVKQYGDWFTYERTPRALIFKREHGKVRDTTSMLALMEYNDFRHDPLSRCSCTPPYSAENAIAARNDLNPANGSYPFGALGHRSHGSIDTKITTADYFMGLQFIARSGPVYNENLPPFVWSEADFGATTPHLGHPDVWQFQPVTRRWGWK